MKTQKIIQTAFAIIYCSAGVSGAAETDISKPSSKLRRFVSDVIFEVAAGDREKYSKRLPGSITVNYHCLPAERQLVESHLEEFLSASGVKVESPPQAGSPSASIAIYFGDKASLTTIAKSIDRQISIDDGFTYWTWWGEDRTISRGVVFICTDKLAGKELEDRLTEQLLGIFGLPARSSEFDETCLSSKESVFTSLQPLDKATLKFIYQSVPPGTKPREFDTIFREKWEKVR